MIDIKTIYNGAKEQVIPIFKRVYSWLLTAFAVFKRWCVKFGRAIKNSIRLALIKYRSISIMKKLFTAMTVFIVTFFVWQLFAYSLPETTFVLTNLVFVTIVSLLVCYILFMSYRKVTVIQSVLSDNELSLKIKDQEISMLRAELEKIDEQRRMSDSAKISVRLLDALRNNKQAKKSHELAGQYILRSFSQCFQIYSGVVYLKEEETDKFILSGQFALSQDPESTEMSEADGLVGQVIKSGKSICVKEMPEVYMSAMSGLGRSTSLLFLYVLPIKRENEVCGIVEVTSFSQLVIAETWDEIVESFSNSIFKN